MQLRRWPEQRVTLPILLSLWAVAALAWLGVIWQAHATGALQQAGVPMALGMGGRLGAGSLALFLALWLVMMVAMMFPSFWPAFLLYGAAARRRGRPGAAVLFGAGYLLLWEGCGLLAFAGYLATGAALEGRPGWAARLPLLTAALLLLAAAYQVTPLKRRCLAHCQSPAAYLVAHWRPGLLGALRLGMAHGAYCLGCCWGLLLALLGLGAMDPRWLATAAAVIALEKLGPRHPAVPALVAAVLVICGLAIVAMSRDVAMA